MEKWRHRVAPGGVSSISCLRGQPEPGSGSLTHVPANRPCGQLWQVWPSHLTETHRVHSQYRKSWRAAVIQLWSSFVPPDRARFHVMMPMSLAAGKWAPLTNLEVFSSCPAQDGAHSHAFRYSGKNGLTLNSENEWMQLLEGHHLVLMFTQKASGQLLRKQT